MSGRPVYGLGDHVTSSSTGLLRQFELGNVGFGLKTFSPAQPGNPKCGQWAASFWNGPTPRVIDHTTETGLLADLRKLFGNPTEEEAGPEQSAESGKEVVQRRGT